MYYRVSAAQEARTLDGVGHLFRALQQAWPGLTVRLMHKVDPDGPATWMEVYEHPGGLDARFVSHMQDLAQTLLADQTGLRHVEVFTPVSWGESASLG